jgi:hypothetical protein
MRVLVLRGTGQLGRGFVSYFKRQDRLDSAEIDLHGITNVRVRPRNVDTIDL